MTKEKKSTRTKKSQPNNLSSSSSSSMGAGQRVGYLRVSTADQNTSRQLADIEVSKRFVDKLSGKDTKRPQLQEMLDYVREGDTVVVHSLDRLGRNLKDLREIVDILLNKGVTVQFIKENLTFTPDKTSSMGNLLLNIMGAFAEFERELILERQKEGIRQAKLEGKYTGGKKKLEDKEIKQMKKRHKAGESVTMLAKNYGITRQSVYNYLKEG